MAAAPQQTSSPEFIISNVSDATILNQELTNTILTNRKVLLNAKIDQKYQQFIKYDTTNVNKIIGINIYNLYTELTKTPATAAPATTPPSELETFKNTLKTNINTLRTNIFEDNTPTATGPATAPPDVNIDNAKEKFKNFAVNSSVIKILTVIYAFVVFADKHKADAADAASSSVQFSNFKSLLTTAQAQAQAPVLYNPFMFKDKPIFQYLKQDTPPNKEKTTEIIKSLLNGNNPSNFSADDLVTDSTDSQSVFSSLSAHLKNNEEDIKKLAFNLAKNIIPNQEKNQYSDEYKLHTICKILILRSVREIQHLEAKNLDNLSYATDTLNLYSNFAIVDKYTIQ
jgi:hypothetical protein